MSDQDTTPSDALTLGSPWTDLPATHIRAMEKVRS